MNKRLNIFYWLRKIFVSSIFQKFFLKKNIIRKYVFYSIYKSNHWNRYVDFDKNNLLVSGPGSMPGSKVTQTINKNLSLFIRKNNLKSILDIPCGDFSWISELVKANQITYVGYDIVEDIVNYNIKKFSSKKIKFFCKDIVNETNFGNYDLILSRDFFIHMSNEDIKKVLFNIKKSKGKFFACSNNSDVKVNSNILIGQHRKVNLSIHPFNLGKPYFFFYEGTEDCFINIYKISEIK